MAKSRIALKGQVTIPKSVRDQMGLKPEVRIDFVRDGEGWVIVNAMNRDFLSLKGIIKSPLKRAIRIEEMNEAIARGAASEVMRSLEK